jgi:hypothetical protein
MSADSASRPAGSECEVVKGGDWRNLEAPSRERVAAALGSATRARLDPMFVSGADIMEHAARI